MNKVMILDIRDEARNIWEVDLKKRMKRLKPGESFDVVSDSLLTSELERIAAEASQNVQVVYLSNDFLAWRTRVVKPVSRTAIDVA